MASKAELLERAKEQGFSVNTKTPKSELESMLKDSEATQQDVDNATEDAAPLTQEGSANPDGEKTNGTTKDGDESPVEITDSVPQNNVDSIKTAAGFDSQNNVGHEIAKEADEARTKEELAYANESNPNQKARNAAAPGKYDQDGNERGGGQSYGVAADDTTNLSEESVKLNAGEKSDDDQPFNRIKQTSAPIALNQENNYAEWTLKEQRQLEEDLSSPSEGVSARVTTSAGNYVRVKFFLNNKPLGTFKSRDFKKSEAQSFLNELLNNRVDAA